MRVFPVSILLCLLFFLTSRGKKKKQKVAARIAKEKEEALKREQEAKNSPSLGRAVLKKNASVVAKEEVKADPVKQPLQPAKAVKDDSSERRMSLNVDEVAAKKQEGGDGADDGSLSVRSQIIDEADKMDKEV